MIINSLNYFLLFRNASYEFWNIQRYFIFVFGISVKNITSIKP